MITISQHCLPLACSLILPLTTTSLLLTVPQTMSVTLQPSNSIGFNRASFSPHFLPFSFFLTFATPPTKVL
jgi:hypothetical protein